MIEQLLVVLQVSLVRYVKTPIYVRREKKLGESNFEKLLFYQFRTLSRKNLEFQQNNKPWFSKM